MQHPRHSLCVLSPLLCVGVVPTSTPADVLKPNFSSRIRSSQAGCSTTRRKDSRFPNTSQGHEPLPAQAYAVMFDVNTNTTRVYLNKLCATTSAVCTPRPPARCFWESQSLLGLIGRRDCEGATVHTRITLRNTINRAKRRTEKTDRVLRDDV